MFEKVLPKNAIWVINNLSQTLNEFYLSGGTGLALQIGHRKSLDLDFLTTEIFNTEILLEKIRPEKILLVREGTIHCELNKVKLSFLFYSQPLIYEPIIWRNIKIADYKDITAEKFKSISQRGRKKDFYDLYAVLQLKLSIEEACNAFKARFASSGINFYFVLKSLVYFEDAEEEPQPILLLKGREWEWKNVKKFFEKNIRNFEKFLLT